MNETILSQVPLFVSLPPDEIHHLAETLHPFDAPAGWLLFREGEHGDRFYITLEGEIEIIKSLDGPDEHLIGVRGAGEYVGEMSLFNRDGLRTASARARTAVRLFEMTRTDFDALLQRQPALAYEMVRVLSIRLSDSNNKTVRDMYLKNVQLTEAYQSLQAAQAQLIEKEKLERELQVARGVQASLIPRTTPRLDGWGFAARWQPARTVSGDFYDFIPLPHSGAAVPNCGIVIADVADKGMPAALLMTVTRSVVRASVIGTREPAKAIELANRLICADAMHTLFVTLLYAQLDPATGELIYVNAGHNPAWLLRAASGEWIELTRTGLPLGLFDWQSLEQSALPLEPGDVLWLYTDGVIDALNAAGESFGAERLRHILAAQSERLSAEERAALLEQALQDFCGGQPPFDDVTFIVVQRERADTFTRRFTAELNNLAAMREFVREAVARWGASTPVVEDLALAVDELTTNIISHGYGGRPDLIEIVVRREADGVLVQLRDSAPPFDPTQLPEFDPTLPLHLRPLGGMGVFLARRLVDALTYRRTADNRNEITLTKRFTAGSRSIQGGQS
jgi:serine phosphatase RsbU (regulator of sigma subunit)